MRVLLLALAVASATNAWAWPVRPTPVSDENLFAAGLNYITDNGGAGANTAMLSAGDGGVAYATNECKLGDSDDYNDNDRDCPVATVSRFGELSYWTGAPDWQYSDRKTVRELMATTVDASNFMLNEKDERGYHKTLYSGRPHVFTITPDSRSPKSEGETEKIMHLNISLFPCYIGVLDKCITPKLISGYDYQWGNKFRFVPQTPTDPEHQNKGIWADPEMLLRAENYTDWGWAYDTVILNTKPAGEVFKVNRAYVRNNEDKWDKFNNTNAKFISNKNPALRRSGTSNECRDEKCSSVFTGQGVYLVMPNMKKNGNRHNGSKPSQAELPLTFQADRCTNDVVYEIETSHNDLEWMWKEGIGQSPSLNMIYSSTNPKTTVTCNGYGPPPQLPDNTVVRQPISVAGSQDNWYCMGRWKTQAVFRKEFLPNYFMSAKQTFYILVKGQSSNGAKECKDPVKVTDIEASVTTLYRKPNVGYEFALQPSVERKYFVKDFLSASDIQNLNAQYLRAPGVLTRIDGDNIALGFGLAQSSWSENTNYDSGAKYLIVDSNSRTQVSWDNTVMRNVTADTAGLASAVDSSLGGAAKVFDIKDAVERGMLKTAFTQPSLNEQGNQRSIIGQTSHDMIVLLENVRINHLNTRWLKMYIVNAEVKSNGEWEIKSKQEIKHPPLTLRPKMFDFSGASIDGRDLKLAKDFAGVDSMLTHYVFDQAIMSVQPECMGEADGKCVRKDTAAGNYTTFEIANSFTRQNLNKNARVITNVASSLIQPNTMRLKLIDSTVAEWLKKNRYKASDFCREDNSSVQGAVAGLISYKKRRYGLTVENADLIIPEETSWHNNIVGIDGKIGCATAGEVAISSKIQPEITHKIALDRQARVSSLLPNSTNFGATVMYELKDKNNSLAAFEIDKKYEHTVGQIIDGAPSNVMIKAYDCADEECSCMSAATCATKDMPSTIAFEPDEVNLEFFKHIDDLCANKITCNKTVYKNGSLAQNSSHAGRKLNELEHSTRTQTQKVYLSDDILDPIKYDHEVTTKEYERDVNSNHQFVRLNFFGVQPYDKAFVTTIEGTNMLVTMPRLRFADIQTDASGRAEILNKAEHVQLSYIGQDGAPKSFLLTSAGQSCKDIASTVGSVIEPCYNVNAMGGMPGFEANSANRVKLASSYQATLTFEGDAPQYLLADGSDAGCAAGSFELATASCKDARGTAINNVAEIINNGKWVYQAQHPERGTFKDVIGCNGVIYCDDFTIMYKKK